MVEYQMWVISRFRRSVEFHAFGAGVTLIATRKALCPCLLFDVLLEMAGVIAHAQCRLAIGRTIIGEVGTGSVDRHQIRLICDHDDVSRINLAACIVKDQQIGRAEHFTRNEDKLFIMHGHIGNLLVAQNDTGGCVAQVNGYRLVDLHRKGRPVRLVTRAQR